MFNIVLLFEFVDTLSCRESEIVIINEQFHLEETT